MAPSGGKPRPRATPALQRESSMGVDSYLAGGKSIMFFQQVHALMVDFWASAMGIFWFFIVSILVAAAIDALKFDRKVVRFFERAGVWSIMGALLLGIVSPF